MAGIIREEIITPTESVKVGDNIRVGGIRTRIVKVERNKRDECVFHLEIVGGTVKSRSKAMLIIPKENFLVTLH